LGHQAKGQHDHKGKNQTKNLFHFYRKRLNDDWL
jgi:hypothetical protein